MCVFVPRNSGHFINIFVLLAACLFDNASPMVRRCYAHDKGGGAEHFSRYSTTALQLESRQENSFCLDSLSNNHNHSSHQRGGKPQQHTDEGSFDMEPVVVVGVGHVLRAWNNEVFVVAESDTIQHQRVEPVTYSSK